MNLSTPSLQNTVKPKSQSKPNESPESCGSKGIADPILATDNRCDALALLDGQPDLTAKQKRHLNRVVLNEHKVVRVGKPKQDSGVYWNRKIKEMNARQLAKAARRIIGEADELVKHVSGVHKSGISAAALRSEQQILTKKLNAINEELIARKVN